MKRLVLATVMALVAATGLGSDWVYPPQEELIQIRFVGGSPEAIKRNQVTTLEVVFEQPFAKTKTPPTALSFDAQMPEHRHGMLTKAVVTPVSPGRFRIEGVNLHMAGYWELVFRLETNAGPKVQVVPLTLR